MVKTFARRFRLTKTDEFSSVFGFRRAIRGTLLMLHYQPRTLSPDSARLGLVVGKKQLKRAVDRNRLKRIVREDFRLHREMLPACDLIVRLSTKLTAVSPAAVRSDLQTFWQRLPRRVLEAGRP